MYIEPRNKKSNMGTARKLDGFLANSQNRQFLQAETENDDFSGENEKEEFYYHFS